MHQIAWKLEGHRTLVREERGYAVDQENIVK